jgi:uncharacterized damage-inducible protein DinB
MFRSIADFLEAWKLESEKTRALLAVLTDASLATPVSPGGRTLGRIAWHVVTTLGEMAPRAGLAVDVPGLEGPQPLHASMMSPLYQAAATAVAESVASTWNDAMLAGEIEMYGEKWTRGGALVALIAHQTHHRGQMTVLMRQAGLKVPGVYGPAKEEWAAIGMEALP